MAVTPARRLTRAVILPAVVLALAALASGCKGQVAVSAQSASPPASAATGTTAGPTAASATQAAAAGGAAAGTGSLSVSVTSPVTLSGSTAVAVSCVTSLSYRASVTSAVIRGDQV